MDELKVYTNAKDMNLDEMSGYEFDGFVKYLLDLAKERSKDPAFKKHLEEYRKELSKARREEGGDIYAACIT